VESSPRASGDIAAAAHLAWLLAEGAGIEKCWVRDRGGSSMRRRLTRDAGNRRSTAPILRLSRKAPPGARRAVAAAALAVALAPLTAQAADSGAVPPGSRYLAMGSSFASGPGVTQPADPGRCMRSADNYAHQLARRRNLQLVDVTCGGATTAHILGSWGELPPQVDALTPDTRLVTVTIGGNDVNYIGGLLRASCQAGRDAAASPICRYFAGASHPGGPAPARPDDKAWSQAAAGLEQIVQEVRRRAPAARLVFVDYFTVLPEHGLCSQTPLSEAAAAQGRDTAQRLAQLTAEVGRRNHVDVVRMSDLSRDHDACARAPWVTGFLPPPGAQHFMPYHPNLAGMTAAADALDRELGGPSNLPPAAAVR
jgi:lysophospholipase L1-like esterase